MKHFERSAWHHEQLVHGVRHDVKDFLIGFLRALIIPPISLAVWFGIISFFVMVYLTAGGT